MISNVCKRVLILVGIISLLLCVGAFAEEYPQSPHPYENNSTYSQTYTHPEEAEWLAVTFSEETEVQYGGYDVLNVYRENGAKSEYIGTQLQGRTIFIQGNSFRVQVVSDGSGTSYGFAVTNVVGMTQEEYEECIANHPFEIDSSGNVIGYNGTDKDPVIPEIIDGIQVNGIRDYAFAGRLSLTSMTLPEGITHIGNHAFEACWNLESVTLPDGLVRIGDYAFKDCWDLTDLTIPDSVTGIGSEAFRSCESLTTVTIPDGITRIAQGTFLRCESLTSITIPDSVKSIATMAFSNCESLTSITIPNGVTRIENRTFSGCSSLENVELPDGLKIIGPSSFHSCYALADLIIPDSVTSIGSTAFCDCHSLISITIPDSVTDIGIQAFDIYNEELVIRSSADAYARTWAEKNGITWELAASAAVVWNFTATPEMTDGTCTSAVVNLAADIDVEAGLTDLFFCITDEIRTPASVDDDGHATGTLVVTENGVYTVELHYTKDGSGCKITANVEINSIVGHQYGEWTTLKAATVYSEGLRERECSVCGKREEETIPPLEIDEDVADQYGRASFRVVNALTNAPIAGAQLHIQLTEEDRVLTIETGADGSAVQILPVGTLRVTAYAPGMIVRNLNVKVKSGECIIPDIGLSDTNTVGGNITVEEMSLEEIIDAGIDITDPDNQHVYRYEIQLEFDPEIPNLNLHWFLNLAGKWPVPPKPAPIVDPDPDPGLTFPSEGFTWEPDETSDGKPYFKYGSADIPKLKVYPVSESFYLIIYGESRWLKEMFDVEMLVFNKSVTDTIEDCVVTLALPEGLSLADMTDGEQTLSVNMGTIQEGGQKSVHWYVRGDQEGSYNIEASLHGVMQPFEEPIEHRYQAKDSIEVLAGSAMHLTYYVPEAAYYGEDYVVRAELENVSDKNLYNVSHILTGVKEGKITYYSNGITEETIYLKPGDLLAENFVKVFRPGDKLEIEISIPVHMESVFVQEQIDRITSGLKEMERIKGTLQTLDEMGSSVDVLSSFLKGLTDWIDLGKVKNLGPKLESVYNGQKLAKLVVEEQEQVKKVRSAFDILCDALNTIPVRFELIKEQVVVADESTVVIPTEIKVLPVTEKIWSIDIDNVMDNFMKALFAELVEAPQTGNLVWDITADTLVNVWSQLCYDSAMEELNAIDGEVQKILNLTPGSDCLVHVWSENGSMDLEAVGGKVENIDGELYVTGSSYLMATLNGQDDILHVEVDDEPIKKYLFNLVQKHTCVGEWFVVYYATEESLGFEIQICPVCEMVLDTKYTSSCGKHSFSKYEMDVEPTEEFVGIQTRVCSECHVLEYEIVEALSAGIEVSFDANGAGGENFVEEVPAGSMLELPENPFTHETLKFVCWSSEADGSGTLYAPGAQVQIDEAAAFYAIWSETGYLEYDMSEIALESELVLYNGQEHEVRIMGIPEGVSIVNLAGNIGTEPGEYTVTAELVPVDEFHAAPVLPELKWRIERAISYEGTVDKVYDGTSVLDGRFVNLTDEEIVLEYARVTVDEAGSETIEKLTTAPADAGVYRMTASVTFGEEPYTEMAVVDYLIRPREVHAVPNNISHVYDGLYPEGQGYEIHGLLEGHSAASAVVEVAQVLPGTYSDGVTIRDIVIVNEAGDDVTVNYQLNCSTAVLEILQRGAVITACDVLAEYDGKAHGGAEFLAEGLLNGHRAQNVLISGSAVEAGDYRNLLVPESAGIVDEIGSDVTQAYRPEYIPGSLKIEQRPVWIKANAVEHEYDGSTAVHAGYTVRNLVEGHQVLSVDIAGGQVQTGTYPAEFVPSNAVIVDENGVEVTKNYLIEYESGDLTITVPLDYLQSEHPYQNDTDYTWSYTHPKEVAKLAITFSEDTELEWGGDYICIDSEKDDPQWFTGTELSGKTIFVSCRSFTIRLTSDGSVEAHGFAVTRIVGMTQEEFEARRFTINSDGIITAYEGTDTELVIPEIWNGVRVTGIGDHVFEGCDGLESVIFSEGVMTIGSGAFAYCSSLTNVVLPEGVTTIGDSAFESCSNLTNIVLPEGVTTIGDSAFVYCSSLESVTFPDSVTSIGDTIFEECPMLMSIALPDGVVYIGADTFGKVFIRCNPDSITAKTLTDAGYVFFSMDEELPDFYIANGVLLNYVGTDTEIVIPDGVTAIGKEAFSYNVEIISVEMPQSVISIGESAFVCCESLESIDLSENLRGIGMFAFEGCSALASIEIPHGVTEIEEFAFAGCNSLEEINIPEGVTHIASAVFQDCESLTSLSIPEGVTAIETYAFNYCTALASIDIPDSVTHISSTAFQGCESLVSVTIPEGVEKIESYTFFGCRALELVEIPNSVTAVEEHAFCLCSGLESVMLPDGITTIGEESFETSTTLRCDPYSITARTLTEAGYDFEATESSFVIDENGVLTAYTGEAAEILIPDGVTRIGEGAFRENGSIISATLPDGVRSVDKDAFYMCANLRNVTFPDTVTSIGDNAFYFCESLESVTFPGDVTSIGDNAFYGCENLESVTFLGDAESIGDFAFCCDFNLGSVLFSGNIKTIGEFAFLSCYQLESVTFLGNVTTILFSAFDECLSLAGVVLPDGITDIRLDVFDSTVLVCNPDSITADTLGRMGYPFVDKNLMIDDFVIDENGVLQVHIGAEASLVVPEGVTSIGDFAFAYSPSLQSVTLPEGVTHIEEYAFLECTALQSISIPGSVDEISDDAFYGCNAGLIFFSPVDAYAKDWAENHGFVWKSGNPEAKHTEVIDAAVPATHATTGLTQGSHCSVCGAILVAQKEIPVVQVQKLKLPGALKTIDAYAFSDVGAECIVLPDGCETIGSFAFRNAVALRFIEIPASVTSIKMDAFQNCRKDLIIVTTNGSFAEEFAQESSITCVILPE